MQNEMLTSLERQLESYHSSAERRGHQAEDAGGGPAWLRFAAAAGASLAAASDADAAIQHFVPPSPIRVTVYDTVATAIDLDGVGDYDLQLGAGLLYPDPYNGYRIIGTARGIYGAAVVGTQVYGPFGTFGVRRFNSGDMIPAATPAISGQMLQVSVTNYSTLFTYNGQFGINGTGYAGFVNSVSGSLHAGWIKIRTESFDLFGNQRLFAVSVLEWAYEDVAGRAIEAGQTVSEEMGIPGDYNNNGVVDAADYTVWRDHLGQSIALDNEGAGVSEGEVAQDDYTFWKSQFGNSGSGSGAASSAATSVPEPSTVSLGMLALGAAGIAALRRRKI
jgi:hypothetical protein